MEFTSSIDTSLISIDTSPIYAVFEAYSAIASIFCLFIVVCWWRIFSKAGQKGWKILIPIYNIYIMSKVAKVPTWAFVMVLIPFVNFIGIVIFQVYMVIGLAKAFGKESSFAVFLFFLSPIALPILAFGKSTYVDQQPVQPQYNQPQQPQQPTNNLTNNQY